MALFRLTELALKDLRSIGRYTQNTWGREQRNIYLKRLDDCFQFLGQQPQRGKACNDIRLGYRKYHVGRHVIFYRIAFEGIEIIRILHERMDVETRLDDK